MQNDRQRLEAILNDPGSTAAEKAVAQAQLAVLDANDAPRGDFCEQSIFRLLRDDGVIGMDDDYLRAVYLADPSTSIWWARLAFWRDRLRSNSSTLRSFAEHCIKLLSGDEQVPADARKAATEFLAQFNQRKSGDPVPAIKIPGNERWSTMPSEELYYKHMVPYKKRFTEVFCTAR